MITFRTASGSTYELDSCAEALRRVNGKTVESDATDGLWRPYRNLSVVTTSQSGHKQAVIIWSLDGANADSTHIVRTVTSPIIEGLDLLLAVVTAGRGEC